MGLPDGVVDGWQGLPPAEGTRRWHILEALKAWILANPGKPVTSEQEAIDFADAIETALLSAEAQPSAPEAAEASDLDLAELVQRLDVASDRERGQLLSLAGPSGAGLAGKLIGEASSQLEGAEVGPRAAALLLGAIGFVDQVTLERDRA